MKKTDRKSDRRLDSTYYKPESLLEYNLHTWAPRVQCNSQENTRGSTMHRNWVSFGDGWTILEFRMCLDRIKDII